MRDHSKHIELSRQEAVAAMLERCTFPKVEGMPNEELVLLGDSFGRVLSRDVFSQVDKPNALQCCMDSIAVHWDDFANDTMPDTTQWVRGRDWEFANTGVAMPQGFDTAIVIEHVQVSEDEQQVSINAAPSKRFAGTRAAGSQMKVGDILAHKGEVVTPDIAARIASGNLTSVYVKVKPRVAFIPTGGELVSPGGYIESGKNIETNSYLVRGKIEAWGGIPLLFDIVPDEPELIKQAILEACEMADIVVLNAGSSKGSEDWNCEQMEELGEVICHETNHGPGHHSSYALINNTPVVGISGPPAGASFTLNFYLRPLMMKFLGRSPEPERVPVRLTAPFPGGPAGGPHAKGAKDKSGAEKGSGSDQKKLAGEVRPSVVAPGAKFFGIKFLKVETSSDGSLIGTPLPGRPGSPQAEPANAYYMLPTEPGATPLKEGDVIWVEFR